MAEVVRVKSDDFAAVAQHEGSTIRVSLAGTADHAALEDMSTVLERIHAEARELAVTEVVIDLRELEFMNSSCFKSFVTWIALIQELDTARQYKVTFVSNPNMHWQKRSLHSLRCFAVELISISER